MGHVYRLYTVKIEKLRTIIDYPHHTNSTNNAAASAAGWVCDANEVSTEGMVVGCGTGLRFSLLIDARSTVLPPSSMLGGTNARHAQNVLLL